MSRRRRRPSRQRVRVKKGNIFFFLLIGLAALVYFNRDKINETLGVGPNANQTEKVAADKAKASKEADDKTPVAREEETQKKATNPTKPSAPVNDAAKKAKERQAVAKEKEKVANQKKPQVRFSSEFDKTIFAQFDNPFQIEAETTGVDLSQVTPVAESKEVKIQTVDAKKGTYKIRVNKVGKAEISLMGKVDGKLDILKTIPLEVVPQSERKRLQQEQKVQKSAGGYMWNIISDHPDTLLIGQPNKLEIAVAESDPKQIQAAIEGGNSTMKPSKTPGFFEVIATKPGKSKVIVKLKEGGNTFLVGEKEFVVVAPPPPNPSTTQSLINIGTPKGNLYQGVEQIVQLPPNMKGATIKADNAKVSPKGPNRFAIRPLRGSEVVLNIVQTKEGKEEVVATQKVAVEALPDPQIFLNNVQEDLETIKAEDLKKAAGLTAILQDKNIPAKFQVVSFVLKYYPADDSRAQTSNRGGQFGKESKALIDKAASGDLFRFSKVKVRGNDSQVRELNGPTLEIE